MELQFTCRIWSLVTITVRNVNTQVYRMMRAYPVCAASDIGARSAAIARFAIEYPGIAIAFVETLYKGQGVTAA